MLNIKLSLGKLSVLGLTAFRLFGPENRGLTTVAGYSRDVDFV